MEHAYPRELKIGAHTYKLVFSDTWPGRSSEETAQINQKEGVIYIDGSFPSSLIFSTVIHEVLHGLNTELDHTLLESIAEQLAQVFWDNHLIREDIR